MDIKSASSASDWNPYLAGLALGLLLLAVFVVMGRGLGASGAFAACAGSCVTSLAPGAANGNPFFTEYLGSRPLHEWLVVEIIGVFLGAFLAGWWGRRSQRMILAVIGGFLLAFGARLGGGCTSSQILSGGAVLNVGSWIFMGAVFIGAYGLAWPLRRQWN